MARTKRHKPGRNTYYSLYNLVAGRHRVRVPDTTHTSRSRVAPRAVAPEEYLLKRYRKMQVYPFEEHPDLPDNALVMAIHWYVSKRAAALGPLAYETMDASALLAIAIEVEEKIKAALGNHGHLVYARTKKPELQVTEQVLSDTEAEEAEEEDEEVPMPVVNAEAFDEYERLNDPEESLESSIEDSSGTSEVSNSFSGSD